MSESHDFAPTVLLGTGAAPSSPPLRPPPPQSAFQPAAREPSRPERMTFSGTGGEYFRIWIVNLLLNIVTLGIYSAWAKVRKMRYFYDNTQLAGTSFEYHGNPIAILKGRLIAAGLLIAYNVAPKFSMTAGYAMMAIFALVMPWLTWKSLQFKLYNSSYRGIRFGFLGTAKQAYKVYLLYPILSALTLGLLVPFTHQRIKKFQHDESRFGMSQFSFHGSAGKFYGAYLVTIVIFFAGMLGIIFAGKMFGASIFNSASQVDAQKNAGHMILGFVLMIAFFAWANMVYHVFMTMLQNLIWNNTRLNAHAFTSDMAWTRVMYIALTNVLLIALTLGLFTPFAKIRMLKYRVESMTLIPAGNLDGFVADTAAEVSATGEGVTDLLDFDFAL